MAYSSIAKPTDHFNTVLYTGNATDDRTVTGVGFQPDWLWIKNRADTENHRLQDVVRGATKNIKSSGNGAEETTSNTVKSFDSDGFTLGVDNAINGNSDAMVSWNWKAANSSGSSNSDGSITSTVSANTTAGFSIVKYTGTGSNATVGHGLGAAPSMIIFKNTNSTRDWAVYHSAMNDPDAYLALNQTYAKEASYNFSNNTAPTSSVFSVGTLNGNNGSSKEYIAYCFAEKQGYSKFESYTGNGNADGAFVYTGFLPAFVLIKSTASSTNWPIIDNKRPGYNPANAAGNVMFANTNSAQSSSATRGMDFNSNGFKVRGTNNDINGTSVITYMAFAKNPFVGNDSGTAVPVTAG